MSFGHPEPKPVPAFARTSSGRSAYADGMMRRAQFYRSQADALGMSEEQRKHMLSDARLAEAAARRWGRTPRQEKQAS